MRCIERLAPAADLSANAIPHVFCERKPNKHLYLHTAMTCETYKSTPGLDRIPPAERFATYRAIHKRLMSEDESYRERHNQYVISYSVIIAAALLAAFSSAPGILGSTLLSLLATAIIVYLAFREQHHMNQCIGRILQSQRRHPMV